ncbi:MAG: M23 family metallopeptidase, partial [Bacteroidota bacterium]
MLSRWIWILIALVCSSFNPEVDYRYPLNGHKVLAGTFGELRPNHFHSGIDIKTGGRSGKPVYAIQDGFVYRLKVSPYGFGNAVYLRHPDGRFSVYAHLSRFTPEMAGYIYQRQYTSKQFPQELYLGAREMPVKQGQLIGYSGNSGSSLAPHLHFEIRDPQERILNPLPYYSHLVSDNIPPIVQGVAIEPMTASSRVKGRFRKTLLKPTGGNGRYTVPAPIRISGLVGMEYRAYDLLNGAGNHCGINHTRLFLDGDLIFELDLRKFSFDESRHINQHIDYSFYKKNKQRYERAYVEEGNEFSGYKNLNNQGMIELYDNRLHSFLLELEDAYGNHTTISGKLIQETNDKPLAGSPGFREASKLIYEIKRNVLTVTLINPKTRHYDGLLYENQYGDIQELLPSYRYQNRLVFLLPLRQGQYPVRVFDREERLQKWTYLEEELQPRRNGLVKMDDIQLFFPVGTAFQPTPLTLRKRPAQKGGLSPVYQVGEEQTPLFNSYLVNFAVPPMVDKNHVVIAYQEKGKWKYLGNSWGENGNLYASTKYFGTFCLMADSIPPKIIPLNFKNYQTVPSSQSTLRIKLEDEFSGIDSEKIY